MNGKLHSILRFAPDGVPARQGERETDVQHHDGQGSGADEGGGQGSDDILAQFQAMLDKRGGDANAVALMLYQDNYQLRAKNRQLAAQLPGAGAIVLTGDDAAAWQAYRKLGAPAALEQALQERDQAQGDLAKLRRDLALREAAAAAGYKHSVLAGIDAQAGGLAYEVREVDQDGKKAKVAYVTVGDAEAQPLADYIQSQWADYLPALAVQSAPTAGTPYPVQQSGGKPPAVDLVAQFQQEQEQARQAVKNPLLG